MKKAVVAVLVVVVLAVVCLGGYLLWMQSRLPSITVADVDLANIEDGEYIGKYKIFPVAAEVKVTVKDHRIADVELINHRNGRGKAAEVLVDQVAEKQSLEVDVVSGATFSSKAILKAIESALAGAGQ
ncbi:MAG: FMN-binding protein [Dethiobacteria bacterium]|jgi:uncharacterized protein with FMN-binding domain|nr:FMN-binding protein [Bacillota bacterium]HOP69781.1 FMN-binding protein [Bacillota bacterium]HPT33437.1 FMN-binding protein [Bacillota bacterium]HPZ65083.1 FMN-binding protein [Bacillota bacterium]HQD06298.1 FMN-binding protein [Bacillota bacterium]